MMELDRKYAQLLLHRCLTFNNTDTLLIEYTTHEQDNFVNIIIEESKKMGIKNINICLSDRDEYHDYLKNTNIEDIKLNPLIDRTSWDNSAKVNGCILHINTFIPGLMSDIEPEKISCANKIMADTFKIYRSNNTKYNFPWVICAYPNKRWAEYLFGNNEDSYMKLYNYIIEMCMIDKDNPIEEWNKYIEKVNYYKQRLQSLEVSKLYYKNSLGTNFEIGLPNNSRWLNIDKKDQFGNSIIVNMPSYEIFTTPDYRSTNGIVYSSKPLVFRSKIIDNFYLKFKDGIVIDYDAEVGKELLGTIINNYTNSNRLGEVALVNYDSPISNTNVVFYNTLFDENASCHLALGRGNVTTLNDYKELDKEQIDNRGINSSNIHVDFMIGTSDLDISADTKEGKVKIFEKGNFVI